MDLTSKVFDYPGTLARLGQDESLFTSLVDFFLEDIDGLLARLRTALDAAAASEIEIAAHSIKGLCSNFGAWRAIAAALLIERQAQSKSLQGIADGFDPLVSAIDELKCALAAHSRRSGS